MRKGGAGKLGNSDVLEALVFSSWVPGKRLCPGKKAGRLGLRGPTESGEDRRPPGGAQGWTLSPGTQGRPTVSGLPPAGSPPQRGQIQPPWQMKT